MADLKDDETRLFSWKNLTADEKAAVTARKQKALKLAESEQPGIGSRIKEGLESTFGSRPARAVHKDYEDERHQADARVAEAKADATNTSGLYGSERVGKLADQDIVAYKKGGKVKARGVGCAQRGHGRAMRSK
jgi:hypothetical protein